MKTQNGYNSLQHISSICNDKMSFDTKIFLSLLSSTRIPLFLEVIILLIEYSQFFSQALLFNSYFADTSDSHFDTLFTNMAPIAKLLSPGQLIKFVDENNIAIVVLALGFVYLILKYILIFCVIIVVAKDIKGFDFLLVLWKCLFKIHGRLLFYLSSSLWVSIVLAASQEKFDPLGIGHIPMIITAIIIIIVEYSFSIFVYIHYAYLLPDKSFLASKDNRIETINLTQKFIVQILAISLTSDSVASSLILTSVNLLFSILNVYSFFRILPLYKLEALTWEGSLLVIFTSTNIVFLLRSIISLTIERKPAMDTAILLIFVLIPLLVKVTKTYLNKKSFSLINKNGNELPEVLIQKINIIKHFRRKQKPFTDYSNDVGLNYLIHISNNKCANNVFEVGSGSLEEQALNFNSKASANKIFLAYLENLCLRFPKKDLIKLYLAYYYGRKFQDYGVAIKILFGLQQFSSTKMALNASVLIYEIQKKLKTEYENSKGIDLSTYIYNMAAITGIKQSILKQAELQIQLCQEFNLGSPDLAKIFNYSQKVSAHRSNLEKVMKQVFETLPEYNLEPQLLSARYQLVLNHSILDYLEDAKKFTKRCQKYVKSFSESNLSQENMYQKDNGFMMTTTQNGTTGMVTYCSKSIENIFGSNLTGICAHTIVPPFLQNFFFGFFKNPFDPSHKKFFGNIVRMFGHHHLGYLIEMDFYLNIHPFISQGLYYDVIIRPVQSSKDYIMLSENGAIEAYTKDIGEKLGLSSIKDASLKKSVLIDEISNELGRINLAYNMVYLKDRNKTAHKFSSSKKLTQFDKEREEADEIIPEEAESDLYKNKTEHEKDSLCAVFSSEGQPLALTPLGHIHNHDYLTYHCKVETQFYGSCFVKLITFEKTEVRKEDLEKAKNLIWNASESFNKARVCSSSSRRKSEGFQLGKTITGPTLAKSKDDNFDNLLDSYPLYTDKQTYEFLEKDKTQHSGDEPISSITNQSEQTIQEQQPKLSSSKVDNKTSSQFKKMKEAFGNKWDQEERNAVEKLEIAQKSLGSQKSKSSAQGRISKALREAMTINYYPKYYNVFILVFYGLLLAIFACTLSLKLTFDGDIGSRKEEKDVIRSAETRNDLLTTIQRDLRYMQDLSTGRLSEDDLGLIRKSIAEYIDSIDGSLRRLGALNNKLLLASKGLTEEFRERLFERNVRVFQTTLDDTDQRFIYLNNFQATERIVESGFKGLNLAKTDISAASPYFNFIFRNALNDFLLKCDEISDVFIKALDSDEESTLQDLQSICIATNIIILFLIIISGVVVARQCDTEKKYMLSFVKVNPLKVKEILDGLLRFKSVLEEDGSFEEVSNTDISKFARISQKYELNSKKTKQFRLQNPDLRGIFKKYLRYWLNLIFLMVIVVCFVVLNYSIARDTIISLHTELHQIQFSDRISARLNLAVGATQEMLSRGSNSLIRNELAPIQVDICLEDVKIMRRELSYVFNTDGDIEYDPTVEAIVFQDACPYLNGVPAQACEATKQGTEHAGLLNAASQLEMGIASRRDGYKSSNKSDQVLVEVQVDTLSTTVYPNLVLNYGTTVISETIEKVYEKQILEAKAQSNWIWGSTCIMITIVAALAWYGLLSKIREADGKFKKVLQTLPPNLILSNFVLKSYLLETSQGTLDFVRNQI